MTKEDIIRMAREAGWRVDSEGEILEGDGWHIQTDIVERFAALIAAAEREACAKRLEAVGLTNEEVMADDVLRYHFALNGGAGPISKKGRAIIAAVNAKLKERNNG